MAEEARFVGIPVTMMPGAAVLPSQFFAKRSKSEPELQLMMAVLYEALNCLEKHRVATDVRGRRLLRETVQWLLADEVDWPFSFVSICGVLDLDTNAVRQHLRVFAGEQSDPSLCDALPALESWRA